MTKIGSTVDTRALLSFENVVSSFFTRAPLEEEEEEEEEDLPLSLDASGSQGVIDVRDEASRDCKGVGDVNESARIDDDDDENDDEEKDEFATFAFNMTSDIIQDAMEHDCVMNGWVITSANFDTIVHSFAATHSLTA